MVGNSVRSDVAPVVAIGGRAVHVPYHVTWEHEVVAAPEAEGWWQLPDITHLPALLADLEAHDAAERNAG